MQQTASPPTGIGAFCDKLSAASGAFAGWIMVLSSISIGYEILSRALFSKGTVWVYDITTYSLVWFTFLAAGYVLREKRHLNVYLFILKCATRVPAALEMLALVLVAVLTGSMLVYSFEEMATTLPTCNLAPPFLRPPPSNSQPAV